ncbi:hypothetical protein [Asticcacaulis sp. W401b]|uniref:hypothetical protein n=1 Tax=Asticcacaulis sp. W401b TaxID=3388666 RepID=UPI0039706D45
MFEFAVQVPEDFPLDDVNGLAERLQSSGFVVPGFVPSDYGPLDFASVKYQSGIDGLQFMVLPDRNIASRMARIAKAGLTEPIDTPTRTAVDMMAYAQAMGFDIEPSIAFHELGHVQGNAIANEELSWFRAADRGEFAHEWVDIAMGRRTQLSNAYPDDIGNLDLAFPLKRWQKNYVAILKIAELELSELSPLDKFVALIDWMYRDFMVAGPAAILSAFYFSPSSQRKRVLKQLRSPARGSAIQGIQNAAWDVTHLSDFVKRVPEGEETGTRYLFVSADKTLTTIAPLLLLPFEADEHQPSLAESLANWWPAKAAEQIAGMLNTYTGKANEETWRRQRTGKTIPEFIEDGERKILAWAERR